MNQLILCRLFMCSKDPGYIRMHIHDQENIKDDVSCRFSVIFFPLKYICITNPS